jgi:ADP-ribosyl-[dinitrogen reductase] hydrolase
MDKTVGALLGLAVGDAVGAAVEFMPRGTFDPVVDMTGGGRWNLKAGYWTDDTSMALCLAESLLAEGFDPKDQIKRYTRWYREGYLSSTGECFDIGNTVKEALERFEETDEAFSGSTNPRRAGNGSIMRLAPAVLYGAPHRDRVERFSIDSSRTTHGAAECLEACRLLGVMILAALQGRSKEEILFEHGVAKLNCDSIACIGRGEYREKSRDAILGTGYVVPSLEAALWSFWSTESFKEAILAAANLGDDADTTAAICGQVAGAYYGAGAIPESWLKQLVMRDEMEALAVKLMEARPGV